MPSEPIDIVYTWVNDSFPGYLDTLNQFADTKHDTNPNRTRDNLDVIRYSLRSVARNASWVRRIYLLTCRAQVPPWLNVDHPQIRVVHHDEIMAPEILPTFNSFCIVSHLHRLPGVSRQFLYVEDDMLLMARDIAMFAPDGRPYVHLKSRRVIPRDRLSATERPWNLALANADAALKARFGDGTRRHVIHGPQIVDCEVWARMEAEFADEISRTRASRFRGGDNVPPEFLGRHYAAELGEAVVAPPGLSRKVQGYVSVGNFAPWTRAQLALTRWRKPLTVTLNDSFEDAPNPKVVSLMRAQLERWFPDPSPFEKGV